MKVLHLIHNYYPSMGGAQLVFQRLSEGFANRYGDEVTVLTTNAVRSPSFVENEFLAIGDERVNGVLVRRLPYWRRSGTVLKQALRVASRIRLPFREYIEPLRTGPLSPEMLRATRTTDADVIACVGFPFMQMYYGIGRRGVPLVMFGALHIHDDYIPPPVLRAIARAQAYVAFTEFERQSLIRNGIRADLIHVVGLGVDVDRFSRADGRAIRARYGIAPDALVVAFIGRQARYKGCDTLLQAMTAVWDRRPDAYCVIAGARTEFSRELDALAAALPAHKRDKLVLADEFSDEEKPQWFAACDIFVTVSTDESFGIVYVEAWAAGKPVIGGRIGAVECVIRDGEDGLLVPCRDPDALAGAIEHLLGDETLRARMGRSGYTKVRAENDWAAVVDKVRAIYAGLQ